MKNIFNKAGLIFVSTVILLSSCAKDEADPNIPGSDRDKFEGSWTCKETPSGMASTTFTITIQKHGEDDTVYVYNFNNLGSNEKAIFLISGSSVVIPNQDVSGFLVSTGTGTFNNNKINLTYTVDSDNYTAECTQ